MKNIYKYLLIIIILLIIVGVCYLLFFRDSKITIAFNTNMEKTLSNIEIKKGDSINLPTLEREGFTFLGWYINDTKVDSNYKFDKATILTAKWDDNVMTVNFDTKGGNNIPEQIVKCDEKINFPIPKKEGYEFVSWRDKNDIIISSETKLVCENLTLYAEWKKNDDNVMTVTFDTKGGNNIPNQTVKCGDQIIFPVPKRDGYEFVSWRDRNDIIISGKTKLVCENLTLYAEWKKNETGNPSPRDREFKPVLYLYPEKKEKVRVSFEYPEYLTTTYPKYIDKWEVTAYPDGSLYDKDGKYYYGLYWEGENVNPKINDFLEGFYVEKDEALKFLEEKLDKIGLTRREANEFIMYWLPILEKNEKNLVYFELTDERESYNHLYIEPKPDSILRIFMRVKKVNNKVNIKEQNLETFNRYGFVAVEWGGTNLEQE